MSSYRTYEEWKHNGVLDSKVEKQCSYRTYEEWKQPCDGVHCHGLATVLTVPMRNGNSLLSSSQALRDCWVLTVPMRNGNSVLKYQLQMPSIVLTVPMRNGNTFL